MTESLNIPVHSDTIDFLRTLPTESVQTCITSPPYLGKRNYFIPPRIWDAPDNCPTCKGWGMVDGNPESIPCSDCDGSGEGCKHIWDDSYTPPTRIARQRNDWDPKWEPATKDMALTNSQGCTKCGAWNGVLGDEPFPELFIGHLVEIFREVRRVLRNDGTIWVNMGDSAVDSGGTWSITDEHLERWEKRGDGKSFNSLRKHLAAQGNAKPPQMGRQNSNYKKKDLFGIPWMLAFALRNDGWYLRQDIIWDKPNPYPEPVKDRPTRSHEYIFLLAKKPKYFYDRYAILEPIKYPDAKGIPFRKGSTGEGAHKGLNDEGRIYSGPSYLTTEEGEAAEQETGVPRNRQRSGMAPIRLRGGDGPSSRQKPPISDARKEAWLKSMGDQEGGYQGQAQGDPEAAGAQNPSDMKRRILESAKTRPEGLLGRNRRSVWHIKTKPENWRPILPKDWAGQKHFASYPQKLPELCIKAGTSPFACMDCGTPYNRIIEKEKIEDPGRAEDADYVKNKDAVKTWDGHRQLGGNYDKQLKSNPAKSKGWESNCDCDTEETTKCIVLDPFMGTFTTAVVAERLGRDWYGCDINEQFIESAELRLKYYRKKRGVSVRGRR